jgi:hypothetical protein
MAGTGVILWSIIEGPSRGWASPLAIGAGAGGLGVLALFVGWERITDHPMLNLSFFRQRPFSAATPAVVALTFGLFGALFAGHRAEVHHRGRPGRPSRLAVSRLAPPRQRINAVSISCAISQAGKRRVS